MKILKTRNPYYAETKKKINADETAYIGRAGGDANKDYFLMHSGEKVLLQLVNEQDKLIENENFEAILKRPIRYSTLEHACDDKEIGFRKLLPGIASAEEAMKVYLGFPGYEKRIKTNGFVVLEIGK